MNANIVEQSKTVAQTTPDEVEYMIREAEKKNVGCDTLTSRQLKKYTRRLLKEYGLMVRLGDTKTLRRIITLSSFRDQFGEIARILISHAMNINLHMLLNIDSTGVSLGHAMASQYQVVVPKGTENVDCCPELIDRRLQQEYGVNGTLNMKKKGCFAYHFPYAINGAGDAGALVVARKISALEVSGSISRDINKGLIVVKIPQFSVPGNSHVPGHVVFIPADADADAYPTWYLENIFLPFLTKCINHVKSMDPTLWSER